MANVDHPYELLIADDDPGFREAVQRMLEPQFATIAVESGEQAIKIVERRRVDLVLCDMHMHALTGLEAVRIVKSIHTELPCILMTGDCSPQLLAEALRARVFCVLRKPVVRAHLITTVTSALRPRGPSPQHASHAG